jgi:crotonobetainyl-CoA:carnitine CoA-transferase CaiB-like acyl-CoA transferase
MFCVAGVLLALLHRQKTGHGQIVDAAIVSIYHLTDKQVDTYYHHHHYR